MRSLKPSHREKKRYLLIRGRDALRKTIEQVILDFVGVLGYAEASPAFISHNQKAVVLSINRDALDKIRASFFMSGKDLHIEKVSGNVATLLSSI